MTTDAYRGFVEEHGLQDTILELARPAVVAGRASFEASAASIEREFHARQLSAAAAREVRAAYAALPGEPAVAVRSSGTAEDLPGFSFAGQHETFLNVTGADAVVAAVRNCWASLWSPQAISYRHQNGIAHSAVAMGVVVQVMVPSEVAGIIFTANPATGDRNEMVVNASFGLGEAVVSGQVTPDTYMVDKAERAVSEAIIGPKEQQIVSDGDQGVRMEDVGEGERGASSLSDGQLSELIGNAVRLEELYEGIPQDIEWAFVGGVLHLLQSRPITLLPASLSEHGLELDWTPDPPARCKFSSGPPPRCRLTQAVLPTDLTRRQIVENMPDPLCPLFEELYLTNGLECMRSSGSGGIINSGSPMVGGGGMFVTKNGYAYQRFDFPHMIEALDAATGKDGGITEADMDDAERRAEQPLVAVQERTEAEIAAQDRKTLIPSRVVALSGGLC